MEVLTVAAILLFLVTLLIWACEQLDRMGRRARKTRRDELVAERRLRLWLRQEEIGEYWEDRRQQTVRRMEADVVEDLKFELDTYDSHGFLYLDEQNRRDEG